MKENYSTLKKKIFFSSECVFLECAFSKKHRYYKTQNKLYATIASTLRGIRQIDTLQLIRKHRECEGVVILLKTSLSLLRTDQLLPVDQRV